MAGEALMRGAGSLSGAAAVLRPVGCLEQELGLTVHFLNTLSHGVMCEAEQRETGWTLGCSLLQQDVLGFAGAGGASLWVGKTALCSPGLRWTVPVTALAVMLLIPVYLSVSNTKS